MIEDTLQRYAQQDVPASPLQAADVLVVARRRNRRRARLVGAAAGAAVVLAAFGAVAVIRPTGGAPIMPAGSGCVAVHLLTPPGGGVATVTGIDPTGRYVTGVAGTRDAPQAILWTDGTAEVLPAVFAPQAVNAAGTIVGHTGPVRLGEERLHRPVLFDGELLQLPLPDGTVGGAAYAVNSHGDVLGTAIRADKAWVAVRWRTTGTAAVIVSAVAGATGLGLTDDGVAVGFGAPNTIALRWADDGVTTVLPVPRGADSATALSAAGDWASGDADQPPSGTKDDRAAVRWNLRTGTGELIRGIDGRRISASGTVAGTTGTGAPALWRDGRILTLPTLPEGTGDGGSVAGITADGHTLAGSVGWAGAVDMMMLDDPVTVDRAVPVIWHGC